MSNLGGPAQPPSVSLAASRLLARGYTRRVFADLDTDARD